MSVLAAKAPANRANSTVPTYKKLEKLLTQYANASELKDKIESEAKAKAADLAVEMATLQEQIKAYAEAHRDDVPKGSKCLTVGNARLGWSLNPAKVVYAIDYPHEKVMKYLEEHLPRAISRDIDTTVLKSIIVVKEDVKKDLAKLGVTVAQTEKFYVKIIDLG